MHTDPLPLHTGERAFTSGEVSTAHYGAVLEAPAAGDLFGDGRTEIVADDMQGNVYAWDAAGKLVFHETSNPDFSGAPLPGDPSWAARALRHAPAHRGAASSPRRCSPTSIRAPATDSTSSPRARTATCTRGTPTARAVNGFPVLVEDPDKVASVDPQSHQITFNANVPADQDKNEDQGKIVDTPRSPTSTGPTTRRASSSAPTRSTSPARQRRRHQRLATRPRRRSACSGSGC